ncbi:sensor histidine kinase [Paenibacillus solani]|uniref:histidine kinase n=1 Tax=Paenibacillus solani TaxID=1705565 RepID=A0A0M1NZP8_9BACL|nr:HAMP domain-containing sensor histidine kinase [Paenibacillus solani]KOR87738.1 hypothetical protein AM231_00340 [Paenibacillus solani]
MNPMTRMAFRFIKLTVVLVMAFVFCFVVSTVVFIYFQDMVNSRNMISTKTFLAFIGFVLTILFFITFGWCVGKPLTYLIRWINRLSKGNYSQPLEHFRKQNGDSSGTEGSSDYDSSDGSHNHYRYPYVLYKELFDRMSQLSNQLQRSEIDRLNAEAKKQEWIAAISHDLKTPLSYVEGYAHMLAAAEYQWTDEERQNFSRQISDKTAEMKHLIHDLSRTGRWSVEQFPMNRREEDIVNFLRDRMIDIANHPLAEQASFTFIDPESVCMIDFDSRLLGRVFQNVFMNAVIHNPPGIEIQCSISIDGNHCIIVIEDNGIGINETKLTQAMDQSGKGIAIATAFVEAHAGCMSILPADGKGTCVKIVLPIRP